MPAVTTLLSTATSGQGGGPHAPVIQSATSLEAKVVLLGSQNVGKTSLVNRFVNSSFLPSEMVPSTVGASFLTTRVHDPETDTTIRLQIWDTAGQERFRSISKLYYRGAHAAVLCYDITSRKTFDEMGVWLRELRDKGTTSSDDQTILHIVGTKSDIVAQDPTKREVPFEKCIDFVTQELFPTASSPQPTMTSSSTSIQPLYNNPSAYQSNPTRPGSAHATSKSTSSTTTSPPPQTLSSPKSTTWDAPDQVWSCCHEISAKDNEGIEEVFRVITRKLIEQHNIKVEKQRMLDQSLGRTPYTPYYDNGSGKGGGASGGYFDYRSGRGSGVEGGLLTPGGPGGLSHGGSFKLGYGDKRRSWLYSANSNASGVMIDETEATRQKELQNKGGRCC